MLKNTKLGKEICILIKIHLVETKFAVPKIITIIEVTYVRKNSKIQALIKQLLAKYHFFQEIAQNFTSSKKW